MSVRKANEFRNKKVAELKEEAESLGLKKSGTREELITRIVESSYPVYALPRLREGSVRGFLLRQLTEPGVLSTESLVDTLKSKFDLTEQKALSNLKFYKRDVVRYYGFTIDSMDEDKFAVKERK